MKLHGYYRSSASYRVRIALNLKGVAFESAVHHLRRGEQRDPAFLALNPQGLVPALETEGAVLTQSLAILEYLEERHPDPPLLPAGRVERAQVRGFALAIACDIHPLQNLKVLARLTANGIGEEGVRAWAAAVIDEGLDACARLIEAGDGPYCFGDQVTFADICLVPQLMNARRFGVALRWPRLERIETACLALDAFRRAAPENQPDAE